MINNRKLKFHTGDEIPQLALGTWATTDEETYNCVLTAIKAGYRHIDTAAFYRNEVPIGKALKDCGVPREELFITTKLYETQHREPEVALQESLDKLGLEYVDLYLMHWPVPLVRDETKEDKLAFLLNDDDTKVIDKDWDFVKTWELMQKLPKSKARNIGVSNFSINNIKTLLAAETTTMKPVANQCECHPLLPQEELIQWCKSQDIVFEAYSPLGTGGESPVLKNKELLALAEKYGVSIGELVINWAFKRGYVVLPKSANPERIVKNGNLLELKEEDFEFISGLSKTLGETRVVKRLDYAPFPIFQ